MGRRPVLALIVRFSALAVIVGLVAGALAGPVLADDATAVIHTATGDYKFAVEIADTMETRAKGLMYRQSLAPDAGMLFDFGVERETAFWMQNTYIPLDMLFIGADGTIKTIHANARPLDKTTIPSGAPVRFVLEIPGGRAAEIGAKPGDRLEHDRVVAAD